MKTIKLENKSHYGTNVTLGQWKIANLALSLYPNSGTMSSKNNNKTLSLAFFKNRRLAVVAQKSCILQFRYDIVVFVWGKYQDQNSFRCHIHHICCDKSLSAIRLNVISLTKAMVKKCSEIFDQSS